MTNPPTHYQDFAPCEAVQYDGKNRTEILAWFHGLDVPFWADASGFGTDYDAEPAVPPGQWLVRRVGDTRVTVRDHEPARVVNWYYSNSVSGCTDGMCNLEHDVNRRHPGQERFGTEHYDLRRPVVETHDGQRWTGPWAEVTG